MESVLKKIQDAREEENTRRTKANISDITVDGCQVRMHFDPQGDNAALSIVKEMLISAHLETILADVYGGVVA